MGPEAAPWAAPEAGASADPKVDGKGDPEAKTSAPGSGPDRERKARGPQIEPPPYVPLADTRKAPVCALAEAVAQVLAEDRAYRNEEKGRLYGIADLCPFSPLGHGLPTLRSGLRPGQGGARAATDAEYSMRVLASLPALGDFPLKKWGFVLAGGAASAHLMRDNPKTFNDFDLFLVGLTESQARESINALAAHLAEKCNKWWDKMHVFRTANCITFTWDKMVVQVILRIFSTPFEVIGDFDLGSCAVLWDGEEVRMTAAGRFAAEHGANILNLAAHRRTYEARLVRYFGRGYDIVLPDLNVGAFFAAEGKLPFLKVGLNGFEGCPCHIEADLRLRKKGPKSMGAGRKDQWAAYGAEGSIDYRTTQTNLNLRNFEILAQGRVAGLAARALYKSDLDLFAIEPEVSVDAVGELIHGSFEPGKLKTILGVDRACAVMRALVVHSENPIERVRAVGNICREWVAEMGPQARIPLSFRAGRAERDQGALEITPAQWYGLEPLPQRE